MLYKLSIVEQIEYWQKQKNLTSEEMATAIGLNYQSFLRRKRQNSFSSAEIEKLADYLGLTVGFQPIN